MKSPCHHNKMSSKSGLQSPLLAHTCCLCFTLTQSPLFLQAQKKMCQLRKSGVSFQPDKVIVGNCSEVELISHRPPNTVPYVNDFW